MVVNIAARKIGGLSGTVRIESLRPLSGTRSMSNLFATHCAEPLDSCLRAVNGDVKLRMDRESFVFTWESPLQKSQAVELRSLRSVR